MKALEILEHLHNLDILDLQNINLNHIEIYGAINELKGQHINLSKEDYIKLNKHLKKKVKPTKALKELMLCGRFDKINKKGL